MSRSARSAPIVRALGYVAGTWAALFALTVSIVGDTLTSKQWQYLMTVPFGKWAWAAAFGSASACLFYGLLRRNYCFVGAGWSTIGCSCIAIGSFYLLAPIANPELFTLGYYPWLLCAIFAFIGAKVNYGNPTARL